MKFTIRMVYPPIVSFDTKIKLFGDVLVKLFYENLDIPKDQFKITLDEDLTLSWEDKKDSLFSFSLEDEELMITMSKNCPEALWEIIIRTCFTETINYFSIGEPKYIGFQFYHSIPEGVNLPQMLLSINGSNSLMDIGDKDKFETCEMQISFNEADYRLQVFLIGENEKMACIFQFVFEKEFVNLELLHDIGRIKSLDRMHFDKLLTIIGLPLKELNL